MTEQKDLADACFEYRAKNNLNQLEMGRRCGLPRETINRVERGKKYSRMTETKIRMTIEGRK